MKKKQGLIIGIICFFLVYVSTPLMAASSEVPETIKIGAAPPLTGGFAGGGTEVKEGYEIAVESINKAGGVYVKEFGKKIPLQLILYDCESDPVKAVSKYETLHSVDRVVAYLGGFGSSLHAAATGVADKNKVPYLGVGFALWGIHQRGYRYLFSPFPKSPDYAKAPFDFLDEMLLPEQRPKTVAIWELQDDWGLEMGTMWREQAIKRGYKIVSYEKYTFGTKDFTPLILAAKAAGAEAFFANPITPLGIAMIKQMKELKYNPKFMSTLRAADTFDWSKSLGDASDYMTLCDIWNYHVKLPGSEDFVKSYTQKYGHKPEAVTGPAYVCVWVLANAIERAGTLDREAIRNAIARTDMMTILGRVRFRDDGTMVDPKVLVLQWKKGDQMLIWPKEWATAKFLYPVPKWQDR